MNGILLLSLIALALVALGVIEQTLHRRRLRGIPIRIHVNGTRGKSSVTRLIAAGLRAGKITTLAKTTGTLARLILPDGGEVPVFRLSKPNIIEQVRVVAAAAAVQAQALVVECMALQPPLQLLSEHKMIRSTHSVITNVRPDHLDIMGPREIDVAHAFAGAIAPGGVTFTAEIKHLEVFKQVAAKRGARVVCADEQISDDDMRGFSYIEHRDNVALALSICQALGVARETALRGMWQASADPGVLQTYVLDFFGGRRFVFANGFAANDPQSTQEIWNITLAKFPQMKRRIAIFNCRSDRPERSQQLGKACAQWTPADAYVLTGSGTYLFARAARKSGLDMRKVTFAERRSAAEIFETVVDLAGPSALIMGMGNVAGNGLELVRYFRNRSAMANPEAL